MPPRRKASLSGTKPASVTSERFTRLYRMVQLLGAAPQTRPALLRRLRIDTRGFYRDLEALRHARIEVVVREARYSLAGSVDDALAQLPFPDPHLTLGEVLTLSKGRSAAHRKLKEEIDQAMP